jgi:hypothetical protein
MVLWIRIVVFKLKPACPATPRGAISVSGHVSPDWKVHGIREAFQRVLKTSEEFHPK